MTRFRSFQRVNVLGSFHRPISACDDARKSQFLPYCGQHAGVAPSCRPSLVENVLVDRFTKLHQSTKLVADARQHAKMLRKDSPTKRPSPYFAAEMEDFRMLVAAPTFRPNGTRIGESIDITPQRPGVSRQPQTWRL